MSLIEIATGGAILLCSFATTVLPMIREGGDFKKALNRANDEGLFSCFRFLCTPLIGIGLIIIGIIRYKIGW